MEKINIVPKGFDFSPDEWKNATLNKHPLVVVPFISDICSADCIYCMMAQEREMKHYDKVSLEEHEIVLRKAYENGCRTIVITGLGEPFLDKIFFDKDNMSFPLLDIAEKIGMYTIVFSNCISITEEIANILVERKIAIIAKLSSLNKSTFEYLNGCKISFCTYTSKSGKIYEIPNYIKYLLDAGFTKLDKNATRLIADVIITKRNFNDIIDIMELANDTNMLVCLDPLVIKDNAKININEIGINYEENRRLYQEIKEKYQEYDMAMFDLSKCIIHHNGFVYDLEGNVRQCLSVPSNVGNVRVDDVGELIRKIMQQKEAATEMYDIKAKEDIFGKCPGRCYYSGIHA